MPVLRQTMRRISALVPDQRKRHLKTELFEAPDTEALLRRMQRLGFNPAVVIDVGAYIGEWARDLKRISPSARILMVEPQPGHLDRLCCGGPPSTCRISTGFGWRAGKGAAFLSTCANPPGRL